MTGPESCPAASPETPQWPDSAAWSCLVEACVASVHCKPPGFSASRHADVAHVQVVDRALQDAELSVEDIDWLVLHQANQRILDSAAERLKVPASRVVSNLARYGNTSAGSIPLALDEAVRGGRIHPGSTVCLPCSVSTSWGGLIACLGCSCLSPCTCPVQQRLALK